MEIVVMIIMLTVSFSFLLKLTCHGWPGRVVLSALAALFVLLACDTATTQSKTQIADWLSQPDLMLDTSVWLTVDVAFQIAFCVLYAKKLAGPITRNEKWMLAVCQWFPGLLIFPVLFAMLTRLIFSMPGTDFDTIGRITAAALLLVTPLLARGLELLLPEADIRLELMFMVNMLTAALGIVATVNGRTAAVGTNTVEWDALAAVAALVLAGAASGIFINRYVTAKKITKLK
ncbi:MAG: hypothetical protein K2K40_05215 [Paramuribaculum sp.]|nr:hypothetical protein [Paramuribaculum sp.]